jgi:hypothetical protein
MILLVSEEVKVREFNSEGYIILLHFQASVHDHSGIKTIVTN